MDIQRRQVLVSAAVGTVLAICPRVRVQQVSAGRAGKRPRVFLARLRRGRVEPSGLRDFASDWCTV